MAGLVNSTGTNSLELSVQRIQGRQVSLFNFAGTGSSTATNADPLHYQVSTGALDLGGFNPGTPTRVLGFVTRFGTAPPDFMAQTLVNLVDKPATLAVTWRPATATPFTSNTDAGLVLDLAGVGGQHYVRRSAIMTDLLSLAGTPSVVPVNPLEGLFALGSAGQVQVFTQFHDYSAALQQRLAQGQLTSAFGAHGLFTDSTATMMADRVYTVFE
jgi:hypothetical protein